MSAQTTSCLADSFHVDTKIIFPAFYGSTLNPCIIDPTTASLPADLVKVAPNTADLVPRPSVIGARRVSSAQPETLRIITDGVRAAQLKQGREEQAETRTVDAAPVNPFPRWWQDAKVVVICALFAALIIFFVRLMRPS